MKTNYSPSKLLKYLLSLGLLGATLILLDSCLEEKFISDPLDPRLPKYTESGNQVAGALINDIAWKTNYHTSFPAGTNRSFYFTNYSGDSVTVSLDGEFTEGPHQQRPISFIVILKHILIQKLEDITSLNGKTFTLDGKVNHAIISDPLGIIENDVYYHYGGTGTFTIQKVRTGNNTYTRQNGEKYHPLIVAGTFEFNFDNISTHVTLGRFDFFINDGYLRQE